MPSSSIGFYEARTSYGMYRNVVPSTKMFSNDISLFQTPQTLATLSLEVKEHLKIVGMFQHLAHYNKRWNIQ
jgi:hypothetical protein